MSRRDEFPAIIEPRQKKFLRAYAECGVVKTASEMSGQSATMHKFWLKRDPVYEEAFYHAMELAADEIEELAIAKAKKGDSQMLMFLLRALRPEKYRDMPANPVQHELKISVVREQYQNIIDGIARPVEALSSGNGNQQDN